MTVKIEIRISSDVTKLTNQELKIWESFNDRTPVKILGRLYIVETATLNPPQISQLYDPFAPCLTEIVMNLVDIGECVL